MSAGADRRFRRAMAIDGFGFEVTFDDAVFYRMKCDHGDFASWLNDISQIGQNSANVAKLVVDRDSERLEGLGGRVDALIFGMNHRIDEH